MTNRGRPTTRAKGLKNGFYLELRMKGSNKATRIMRDTLFQINFKLKTLIKSEIDVIVIKKSDYDKRIKQYSINQKLFNKS